MHEGPFGGPRPLTDVDIIFNQVLVYNKEPRVNPTDDPLVISDALKVFLNSLNSQQPELDIATAEVWLLEAHGRVRYEIDIPMSEPVLVFSHVSDAERTMQLDYPEVELGDSRVLPEGIVRDERDRQIEEGVAESNFSSQTIL